MSRDFDQKKANNILGEIFYQTKWATEAFENKQSKAIKTFGFFERTHYGVIDNRNNSVIPNPDQMVKKGDIRVFNIVADHITLMQTNLKNALATGVITQEGSVFGNLKGIEAYEDPKIRYGEYLGGILRFYNETHIPNVVGKYNITSYDDYVKYFFKFILETDNQIPITLTRWNTSIESNILHTGLAFSYSKIKFNNNQDKIDKIVDNKHFGYFSNLCLNMGFSISDRNPHILVYDISSPAGSVIRERYGIYNLDNFFNRYYINTYTLDNDLIYNNINIYYNKYVSKNPLVRKTTIKCMKPDSEFLINEPISYNKRPFTDSQELIMYSRIRNNEEGNPFNPVKMREIERKIKIFIKKLDKPSALSYINDVFRDQVWNKDFGYHDGLIKLNQKKLE